MNRPVRSNLAQHWMLSRETCFLNHGSFGATPIAVLEEQSRLRGMIENDPVRFFERDYTPLISHSIKILSEFMNADPQGMAFVKNTTEGVNTVLRSLPLQPGDEILVTDHSYQACWNAVDFVTQRSGAKTVVVEVPFRVGNEDEIVDLVMDSVTDRTVLAMIDTVTSATGLRMPFERLVGELQETGVDVLLDAAHGPGIVPLDLSDLGAAYCTGNCHKWLCTPKGSAFLHIRSDLKKMIRPLSISHGASFEGTDQEKAARDACSQGILEEFGNYIQREQKDLANMRRGSKAWWGKSGRLLQHKGRACSIPALKNTRHEWVLDATGKAKLWLTLSFQNSTSTSPLSMIILASCRLCIVNNGR